MLIVCSLLIIIFVSIPYKFFCAWLIDSIDSIREKMAYSEKHFYLSIAPFIAFFIGALEFFKGFLPFIALQLFTDNVYYFLFMAALIVVLNNWNVWQGLKNQKTFFLTMWGIYTFFYPPLFAVFPALYYLVSFTTNSFTIGLVCNVFSMALILWYVDPSKFGVYFSLISLLIIFLALNEEILNYFSDSPQTIRTLFDER